MMCGFAADAPQCRRLKTFGEREEQHPHCRNTCDRQGGPRTAVAISVKLLSGPRTGRQKVAIANLRGAIAKHNFSKVAQKVVQKVRIPLFWTTVCTIF